LSAYARALLEANLRPLVPAGRVLRLKLVLPAGRAFAQRTSKAAFGVVGGLALGAACFMLYKFVPSDWLERLEGPSKSLLPPPIAKIDPESLNPEKKIFVVAPKVKKLHQHFAQWLKA
jgi:hypothetical protein